MDAELLELQRQLESTQQAKSSVRLSDRNVVELVHKLQERGFLDSDLLHTVSGKEYITPDRLRSEIEAEINRLRRVSLIDLSDSIGVDLYHVERQAQKIVADNVKLMLVNGEIISQLYWDYVAEEINEKLQECSQIALAELAAQLHVGSELLVSILEPRIGTLVKGRLEGGQLYTPAYVARINAMIRGAARGMTVPTSLPTVWSSLQQLLQEVDGANGISVDGSFFQSLFNRLVKEGQMLGTLRAGVQWTPTVFAHAQRESVESFFSQNSFITYDVLHKLAIPQPKQYLQARYPEGVALDSVFVHPSMIDMLDAAIEDAVEHGNWIDGLPLLPAYFGSQDASKILLLCPSLQRSMKSSKAIVLRESCVFSDSYIKDLFDRLEKELDSLSYTSGSGQGLSAKGDEPKAGQNPCDVSELKEVGDEGGNASHLQEKGAKKKRGKAISSAKAGSENDVDNQENVSSKGKKNQRKTKDADASNSRSGVKKGVHKGKDESLNIPSEEWVSQNILRLAPDLEDFGGTDDPNSLVSHLSSHLRPMLAESWKKRRNSMLLEYADKRRRLLDSMQKKIDETILDLQLYEKALDLFDDDSSTSVTLQKHLLKTIASPLVDKLLLALDIDNKLKNGVDTEDSEDLESKQLNSADRMSLAKCLTGSLSLKAQAVVEALEGKQVENFMVALKDLAQESGLQLKKLDKKLERALLHSYRKELTLQVSSETDPIALLPEVVALLYLKVYNKAIQAPGRAISSVIAKLKDKLPAETSKVLMDYHGATVTLLALQAAATGEEDDCSADRILSKKELLESMIPRLKGLVMSSTDS